MTAKHSSERAHASSTATTGYIDPESQPQHHKTAATAPESSWKSRKCIAIGGGLAVGAVIGTAIGVGIRYS
jgi:hypothetical protein